MATSANARKHTLTEVKAGPGFEDLQKTIADLLQGAAKPHIPEFGNGYRSYPIRFTGVRIYSDPQTELQLCDIEGVYDCRDHPPFKPGENKVIISGYSHQTRLAKSADIIYA